MRMPAYIMFVDIKPQINILCKNIQLYFYSNTLIGNIFLIEKY